MCSSCEFVVQSTMVTPSSVRGSAPKPTTTSFVRARSWASTPAASAADTATRVTMAIESRRMPVSLDSEFRVEGVAQPVAEQVHPERGERERDAGEGGQPPRDVQEITALGEHAAPRGGGRLHAEAEEADGRLRHDELGEL